MDTKLTNDSPAGNHAPAAGDMKIKGWTTLLPVKIFCVAMIPVLLFASLFSVIKALELDFATSDFMLADLTDPENNDYFFDNFAFQARMQAETLYWLQSEENIRNREMLRWEYLPDEAHYEFDEEGRISVVTGVYDLRSLNWANRKSYGWHNARDVDGDNHVDSDYAEKMMQNAVEQQLGEYRHAKQWIESARGLRYLVTDGRWWIGNVPSDSGAEYFRDFPVYLISEPGMKYETSVDGETPYGRYPQARPTNAYADDYAYNYTYDYDYGYGLEPTGGYSAVFSYIAFTEEAVGAQNDQWREMQKQVETRILLIILPLVAAVALIVILMTGAGRKYGAATGSVNLMAIDSPWLDIGFCAVFLYELAVIYGAYSQLESLLQYGNTRLLMYVFAAMAIIVPLPALWWTLSFVKRCKAGKFWRHTFIYCFIRGVFRALKRLYNAIRAGASLTLKVVLIGAALFFAMFICYVFMLESEPGFGLFLCLVFAAASIYPLLRYARRLHILELGAKSASAGGYRERIELEGGELGSIADSINNISAGISGAVAERLKSERLKTELITNISHDIRTPLTSIITYTDLMKNEPLGNEKAQDYLDIIIQKSARLKTLTDDLFEASKAATGNIEVSLARLDFSDFVRQVLGEMDERVKSSNLDFRVNLPEHAPVIADGKLLWRVMDNLLSNVFKYALKGSRVYIDVAPENGSFRLDMKNMSDHPLNIDPSELLERFKRGDEARGGEGSGLGLSIAQSFVAALGGRFSLSIDGDLFKATLHLPAAGPD